MLTNQLGEKEANYGRLKNEVVSLRHDIEKTKIELSQYQKIEGSTKALDEILVKKKSPLINVGFNFKEKPRSKIVKIEESTYHVKGVKDSNNKKERKLVGQ